MGIGLYCSAKRISCNYKNILEQSNLQRKQKAKCFKP